MPLSEIAYRVVGVAARADHDAIARNVEIKRGHTFVALIASTNSLTER